MRISYIARLAIRNITGHKLRSSLTIGGIAIGVCFIIFLISLGYGLQRISTEEVANLEALQIIEVTPGKSKIIKIDDKTMDKFKGIANVEEAEPQMSVVGTFTYKKSTIEGVVYGKNTEYIELEEVEYDVGTSYTENSSKKIVVNRAVIKTLGIPEGKEAIGKTITLKTNIGSEYLDNSSKPLNKEEDYQIVGVINTEDSPYAYIPLNILKDYGIVSYNSAKVMVNDKRNTDSAKQQIESMGYKTTTLKDTVDQINQFFAIFQLILLSFGAIAVIIAALGMFNTLTISLLEKTREISFMKIMGTTGRDIWRLFIGEAMLIGIAGSTVGIIAGLLIGATLNNFFINLAEKTSNKPVEIFYTPIIFVFLTFGIAVFISFLTGVYPSLRASKIDALESLRYE